MIPFEKVRKVKVIDDKGNNYTFNPCEGVTLQTEDSGRTLKVNIIL